MAKKKGRRMGVNGSIASRSDLGSVDDLEREEQKEVKDYDTLPLHRLSDIQYIIIIVSVSIAVYLLIGSSSPIASSRNEPFYSHRTGKHGRPGAKLPCVPQATGKNASIQRQPVNNTGGWQPANQDDYAALFTETCDIIRKPAKRPGHKKFVRNAINRKKFEREYRHVKPLIVQFDEGLGAWADEEKWTFDNLLRSHAFDSVKWGFKVDLTQGNETSRQNMGFFKPDDLCSIDGTASMRKTSLGRFVSDVMNVRDRWNQSALAVDDTLLSGITPGCNQSISPPSFLNASYGFQHPTVYLGSSRSGLAFHRGGDEWVGVAYGAQRWFLYPPEQTPPGGTWPVLTGPEWITRIYRNLSRDARPMQCVLAPGEILYIPESWYRSVINIGDTVAIGFSSKNATGPFAQLSKRIAEIESDARLEIHQKYSLVFPHLLELHGMFPENTEVISLLGENYAARGDFSSAINTTREALEKDHLLLGAHLNLGKLYFATGSHEIAEHHFQAGLRINPTNPDISRLYGQFLVFRKRISDAVSLFEQAARYNPDLEETFLDLAREARELQKRDPYLATLSGPEIRARPSVTVK